MAKKEFLSMSREVMILAWQFVKKNGYSMSEAMKCAWTNINVRAMMKTKIVKFYFQKVDGSIREDFGTLADNIVPATSGSDRKRNDTVQTYYDTERQDWRCFKKANLVRIA